MSCETPADGEPDEGHRGLEESEYERDAKPRSIIDTGHAEADRGSKVGRAKRHCDEQQAEHWARLRPA